MALNITNLAYINPPAVGAIFGVPISTVDQAIDLWKWAVTAQGYSCTLTARPDGAQMIQVEGTTAETVVSQIGGDRWIVFDSGKFILFQTSTEALTIYRVIP